MGGRRTGSGRSVVNRTDSHSPPGQRTGSRMDLHPGWAWWRDRWRWHHRRRLHPPPAQSAL